MGGEANKRAVKRWEWFLRNQPGTFQWLETSDRREPAEEGKEREFPEPGEGIAVQRGAPVLGEEHRTHGNPVRRSRGDREGATSLLPPFHPLWMSPVGSQRTSAPIDLISGQPPRAQAGQGGCRVDGTGKQEIDSQDQINEDPGNGLCNVFPPWEALSEND